MGVVAAAIPLVVGLAVSVAVFRTVEVVIRILIAVIRPVRSVVMGATIRIETVRHFRYSFRSAGHDVDTLADAVFGRLQIAIRNVVPARAP